MDKIFVEYVPSPGGRGSFVVEFKVLTEAQLSAQEWLNTPDAYMTKLWDGERFTVYT